MSKLQFWIINFIALIVTVLLLINFILEQRTNSLQSTLNELKAQEAEIQFFRSTVRDLLRDARQEALQDPQLRSMLQQRGYLVQ